MNTSTSKPKPTASLFWRSIGALAIAASIGCASTPGADTFPGATGDIIRECGREDAAALSRLVLDFLGQVANYVLSGARIAWSDIEARAEHEGTVVAQCAFVEIASRFLGTETTIPAPAIADAEAVTKGDDDARRAVEVLRVAAGGGRWRLTSGSIR